MEIKLGLTFTETIIAFFVPNIFQLERIQKNMYVIFKNKVVNMVLRMVPSKYASDGLGLQKRLNAV